MPCERPNGGELEQVDHRNLRLQDFLQVRVDGDEQQRITAEIEEVVVQTYTLQAQDAPPDVDKRLFELGLGAL